MLQGNRSRVALLECCTLLTISPDLAGDTTAHVIYDVLFIGMICKDIYCAFKACVDTFDVQKQSNRLSQAFHGMQ